MRISDWSSDVCSSDLKAVRPRAVARPSLAPKNQPMVESHQLLFALRRLSLAETLTETWAARAEAANLLQAAGWSASHDAIRARLGHAPPQAPPGAAMVPAEGTEERGQIASASCR